MEHKSYLSKVASLICVVTCLFMLAVSIPVNAKERVADDTVITRDNIKEVLTYLGIEQDALELDESIEEKDHTVRELRNLIEREANNQVNKFQDHIEEPIIRAKGTKNLSTIAYLDSYHVVVKVAAKYNGKKWLSAGAPKASISQESVGTTSKVASNDLKVTCYSSKIVLSGSVTVNTYIGLGKVGLLKINSNKITFDRTWSAEKNL